MRVLNKVINDAGEPTRNINQKKKSDVLLRDVHSVTNAVGESISSITMWNIVNHLSKHDVSCGSVVNDLKDRKPLFYQINGNPFDPILTRHHRNCRI